MISTRQTHVIKLDGYTMINRTDARLTTDQQDRHTMINTRQIHSDQQDRHQHIIKGQANESLLSIAEDVSLLLPIVNNHPPPTPQHTQIHEFFQRSGWFTEGGCADETHRVETQNLTRVLGTTDDGGGVQKFTLGTCLL